NDDLVQAAFESNPLSVAHDEHAEPRISALCDAYAAGLNYFPARNPQVRPRLITHFEPWYVFAGVGGTGLLTSAGLKPEELRTAITETGRQLMKDGPVGRTTTDAHEADRSVDEIAGA